MCGIVGYASIDPALPVDSSTIRDMLARVRHRGPDDEGVFADAGVTLGHRRLAIIDPEHGHQPLRGARATTVLVMNGEVYNYRELAQRLPDGGRGLRTRSDVEVAAHAYDAWGLDFLRQLDGMYGFALWDGQRRRLVLARDRLGEKPLYYAVAGGQLIFASDLRGVLAHPALERALDLQALVAYLTLEYVPAPAAIARGVAKLEPGTALVLEGGKLAAHSYWRLAEHLGQRRQEYPDAVGELRGILEKTVRSRLVSDVPLGILLSGGVDSSALAALAANSGPVETFTIGFDDPAFDERGFAREVAARIGSRHHEQLCGVEDARAIIERLPGILDEPLGDASVIPTALLSAFARGRITVALGGEGGDELFAGYPMHRGHRVAPLFRALPRPARAVIRGAARLLPVRHGNFTPSFKVARFLRGADAPAPDNHILWMGSFNAVELTRLLTPEVLAAVAPADPLRAIREIWAESDGAPLIARATHLDARTYLPDDILAKVDRASMAVALEVRCPYLAREVVEFAFGLPDSARMRGLTGKRILRDAVRDLVPPTVLRRPKKGFGVPMGAWLRGPLRTLLRDTLSPERLRRDGLFQPAEIERLLVEHERGLADHRKPLWTLMAFVLWLEGFRP